MSPPTVQLTRQACEIVTEAQMRTLARKLDEETVEDIYVTKAGIFDLPDGYIYVRIDYLSGGSIYGGISREGDMST